MRIHLPFILLFLLLPIKSMQAEPIKPLNIALGETTRSKLTLLGAEKNRGRSIVKLNKLQAYHEHSIETIEKKGKSYYQVRETMRLFNEQQVEIILLIEIGEYLRSISYHRLRKDSQGSVIENLQLRLDNPSWEYPEDIFCQPAIPIIFRSLIDNQIEESSFNYWQNDMAVIRMKIKILGKEEIKTVLGEFSCFKGQMVLDVRSVMPVGKFLAPLIQPFMPKTYIWLWANEPYQVLKTEVSLAPGGSVRLNGEVFEYEDKR